MAGMTAAGFGASNIAEGTLASAALHLALGGGGMIPRPGGAESAARAVALDSHLAIRALSLSVPSLARVLSKKRSLAGLHSHCCVPQAPLR